MAYTLLIVDDSATTRGIIKKVLRLTDLDLGELHEAKNGQEGLAKLRETWIDLVLADLNMPVMTGTEMIAAMADDPVLRSVPVVVVSSEGNQTVLDSLAEKGVREVIRKPFEPAAPHHPAGPQCQRLRSAPPACCWSTILRRPGPPWPRASRPTAWMWWAGPPTLTWPATSSSS